MINGDKEGKKEYPSPRQTFSELTLNHDLEMLEEGVVGNPSHSNEKFFGARKGSLKIAPSVDMKARKRKVRICIQVKGWGRTRTDQFRIA